MAYVAPPRFAHGDFVTAEALTTLGDDITDLYTRYNGVNTNFGVQLLGSSSSWTDYLLIHRFRWLWYRGNGTLYLFGGTFTADLESGDAWAAALDLDSLSWLHYGDFLRITGVTWAFEDPNA